MCGHDPLTPEQSARVAANLGIAGMVATQYHRRECGLDAKDELTAVALLALCRAAQWYEPARGFAFSTYAHHCCRQAILHEFGDNGLIPTPRYLRRQANVDHPYRPARDRIRAATRSEIPLDELIDRSQATDPVHQAELHELHDRIRRLPGRERYATERTLEGWTGREIGRELGCTKQQVANILASARDRLRSYGPS